MLRTLPTARVTPSKPNIWEGRPVDGSPWTYEQLRTLARERPDRTDFDAHKVKLQPPVTDSCAPPPEPYFVDCPIIARRRDGRRMSIVTPGGFVLWIKANG